MTFHFLKFLLAACLGICVCNDLLAQSRATIEVLNARITPHLFDNNSRFWYRREMTDGAYEFVLVDATAATRLPAFDHAQVAVQMNHLRKADQLDSKVTEPIEEIDAQRLPIRSIAFSQDGKSVKLLGEKQHWNWDIEAKILSKLTPDQQALSDAIGLVAESERGRSVRNGPETEIQFDNRLSNPVSIFWMDASGNPQPYGQVAPATRRAQHTFSGHRWLVQSEDGTQLAVFEATDDANVAIIDGSPAVAQPRRRGRGRNRARSSNEASSSDRSPDGKRRAMIKDNNIFTVTIDADGKEGDEIQLSTDGNDQKAYHQFYWSKDSKSLIAFRVDAVDIQPTYLLQSSAKDGSRAILTEQKYALPGDPFPKHELNLFDVASGKQLKPDVDPFEHNWESPRLRWNTSTGRFSYLQIDRGHQRLRVIEVDPQTGLVVNIIDQHSPTFIWTMHTEGLDLNLLNWLEKTDEVVYVSEHTGWRHLYLAASDKPGELKPITDGQWVIRGIQQIDETSRQIWFSASGMVAGQDPYLVHYGRVNFDGSGLVWLTDGNGQHSLQYSPDKRFAIDTYSRVDQAPIHELRDVTSGRKICDLERADDAKLREGGWQPPEVFVAKGRDGVTDIWGIICRPRDFDPTKSYPIIEDIYAGPQDSYVPKSFSPSQRYKALNDLGFIVVKIDGMGTANRSKAFHDVCWKNLKDAGFEDRILWIKAAAKQHPEMDVNRVGIYGVSAGGQNAGGAVLFHPEFYKVAVAGCGCHDNRMDKASWNEQWMGYPVGPHYAECSNIDNAHRLQGKLLLIVGELDDNVPPASTLRFADALIRADKDFDLLVVPNAGHGIGGAYGERRMREFFVRHLK